MTNQISRSYLKKGKGDEARVAKQIKSRCLDCGRSLNRQRKVKVKNIAGQEIVVCKWCAEGYEEA